MSADRSSLSKNFRQLVLRAPLLMELRWKARDWKNCDSRLHQVVHSARLQCNNWKVLEKELLIFLENIPNLLRWEGTQSFQIMPTQALAA